MVAKNASQWLRIEPGTDGALAWGMANVIIDRGMYDETFVTKYSHGWKEFCERAKQYPLSWASDKTGLSVAEIIKVAETYATTKPAAIHWGVSLEQTKNCTNTIRLLISLMAMTGNLDRPGGNVLFPKTTVLGFKHLTAVNQLTAEQNSKRLGGDRFRLSNRLMVLNPKMVWDAILEEKPYPIKSLYLISTNPLIDQFIEVGGHSEKCPSVVGRAARWTALILLDMAEEAGNPFKFSCNSSGPSRHIFPSC